MAIYGHVACGSMTLIVREFRAADAEAVVEARRSAFPYLVTTPQTVLWEVARTPAEQRHRLLVAEADGRVVGSAEVGIYQSSSDPGQAYLNTTVRADALRAGAGSALVTAAEEYLAGLGAARVYSWTAAGALTFAERRGYRRSRPVRIQLLDLANTPLPPLIPMADLPEGVELCTMADFADDPRPLYEADTECIADEPGDVDEQPGPFEEWVARYWEHPALDRGLSSVVVVGGEVAAYSVAHTDREHRYWSGMTGSPRAFRGRGLAKLAKNDSLHRARAAGYTTAFAGNDAKNGPMLAINQWFGYQPSVEEWRCVRELSA